VDPNNAGGPAGGMGGNPFGQDHPFGGDGGIEIDIEELFGRGGQGISFDDLFGGRRPRGPRPGRDLQMHLRLSFMDAVNGSSQDLNLRYQIRTKEGQVQTKSRTMTVQSPCGIEDGLTMRIQGKGAEGDPGAPNGDLMVTVHIDSDPYFERRGADVYTECKIDIVQAVLGDKVDIRTLSGEVEMKIPAGAQPDSKLVMRGKGIQRLNGRGKGNHIVQIKVEVPKSISQRQEELLMEFKEEGKIHLEGVGNKFKRAAKNGWSGFSFFGNHNDDDTNKANEENGEEKDGIKSSTDDIASNGNNDKEGRTVADPKSAF